ncbi:MAG: RecQ family zinc-binding domain-containing protein, partial [Shewanella sp.]
RQGMQDARWECQLNPLSNESNIRQLPLKTLLVQLEMRGVIKPLYAYYADVTYRFIQDKAAVLRQFDPQRQVFLTQLFAHTQMKRIWGSVDFAALYGATGKDRSRVLAALEYLAEQQMIELVTKGITEVYQVNPALLSAPALVDELHQYFVDKEHKEIQRISQLLRFFELDTCLSHNLSRYFDDPLAPARCGHCSVCRAAVAKLSYSSAPLWPAKQQLIEDLKALQQLAQTHGLPDFSLESQCRFLAGMSLPQFSRLHIRKLKGFGRCAALRYAEIKHTVLSLTPRDDQRMNHE